MSRQAVEALMQRAADESSFEELLRKCPAAGLSLYALSREEKAALMQGGRQRLEALGIGTAQAQGWIALDGLS